LILSPNLYKSPVFSRDYLVHYYEIGQDRRLTFPALMRYFEDIATLHSEARGLPLDYYCEAGQVFLLLKWDISISFLPRFNESVRIETRPTTFKKFLANREYAVYAACGQRIAKARSVWIFTNMKTKRPARVPEKIFEAFGVPPESGTSFDPLEELPEIVDDPLAFPFTAGKRDIDNNGHVNNVRYAEWALESLTADFARTHTIGKAMIHYKKELREGDTATLFTVPAQSGDIAVSDHSIRAENRELCRLRFEWIKNCTET
jgi:medium-chain acyl-[acyl-carrier-protein] hydrolase